MSLRDEVEALRKAAQDALTWSDQTGDVGGHSCDGDPEAECGACDAFEPVRKALAAFSAPLEDPVGRPIETDRFDSRDVYRIGGADWVDGATNDRMAAYATSLGGKRSHRSTRP